MSEPLSTARPRRLYWSAAAFAVLVWPAFLVDLPLARSALPEYVPGDLRRILTWAELFAHGYGVALIGLAVYVLDVPNRRRIPRLLATAYVAGLMANIMKLALGRLRPRYFATDGSFMDTFVGWLPLVFGARVPHESGFQIQSFPSGHAATAVGFAIGLTWLYPRGRWLFISIAVLAALQRIDVRAHYLSDTIAAAAIGCLGAALVMDSRVFGRWFDQFESKTP